MSYPTMRVPLAVLQTAIFERITGDYPTHPLALYYPQDPGDHFSVLGMGEGASDDTKTSKGQLVVFRVDCFSFSQGSTQLNQMMNEVLAAMTRAELDLSADDWNFLSLDASWTATTEAGDERLPLQHGTIRLSITVEDVS